jgi:hypothetical protein
MRWLRTAAPPWLKRGEIEASFGKRPPGIGSDDPVCADSLTLLELSQRLLSSPAEDAINAVAQEAVPPQLLLQRSHERATRTDPQIWLVYAN